MQSNSSNPIILNCLFIFVVSLFYYERFTIFDALKFKTKICGLPSIIKKTNSKCPSQWRAKKMPLALCFFLLATLYPLTLVRPHQTLASLFLSLPLSHYCSRPFFSAKPKKWMSQFSIVVEILSANRDIQLCKMSHRCLWTLDIGDANITCWYAISYHFFFGKIWRSFYAPAHCLITMQKIQRHGCNCKFGAGCPMYSRRSYLKYIFTLAFYFRSKFSFVNRILSWNFVCLSSVYVYHFLVLSKYFSC